MPYMFALYICLGDLKKAENGAYKERPHMYALHVCLICMPYMYALYVCDLKKIEHGA